MKISVLMAVRNGAQFLANSIKDIESNILKDDEILIINDGSSDGTREILNNWAQANKQVRIITTEPLGFANALNLGIKEVSNNWIARFDVDDRYPTSRLNVQRSLISDDISAIFCDYEFWTETKSSLGVIPGAITSSATAVSLFSSQRTPHPGVVYNRNSVLESGGYRNQDFPAEDISLWLRMAKTGCLITVPQVLVNYRLSLSSMSGSNRDLGFQKKRSLIEEIGINHKSIEDCLEEWHAIYDLYSKEDLGPERKILFFRDLRNCLQDNRQKFKNHREIHSILRSLMLHKSTLSALANLNQEKFLRKRYRKF